LCPEPPDVDNAGKVQAGNRTNDTTIYTCTANYKVQGEVTNTANATCGYDDNFQGIWNDIPVCECKFSLVQTKYFLLQT
jgi:hypothetical protein